MSDLISRQAAIDALTENKEMINAVLDSLTLDYNTRRNQEQRRGQINEDIEAIKALPSAQTDADMIHLQKEQAYMQGWEDAKASAQTERKRGEWMDYTEDGYVECPFCHSATNCDGNKEELHFCFSCGADMRGERKDDV
jgi:hypothetical protein